MWEIGINGDWWIKTRLKKGKIWEIGINGDWWMKTRLKKGKIWEIGINGDWWMKTRLKKGKIWKIGINGVGRWIKARLKKVDWGRFLTKHFLLQDKKIGKSWGKGNWEHKTKGDNYILTTTKSEMYKTKTKFIIK